MPTLPSSLALATIVDYSQIIASDHRNNYTSIQSGFNNLVGVSGLASVWTQYSPTWTTNGSAPALGNGSLIGRYWQVGKFVSVQIFFSAGSTTTFGTGSFFFSYPVTEAAVFTYMALGSFWIIDNSANSVWTGTVTRLDTTKAQFFTTGAAGAYVVTAAQPFAWAVSDQLVASFAYEAA